MFLGGLFHGILRPRDGMVGWGMTTKISSSNEARAVWYGHTIRSSTLGLLVLILYAQKNYTAVDTTMAVMGTYTGLVDVIVICRYGVQRTAVERFLSILPIIFWGFAGMTSEPAL